MSSMDVSRRRRVLAVACSVAATSGFVVVAAFDVRIRDAGRSDLAQLTPASAPFVLGIAATIFVGVALSLRTRHVVGPLFAALGLAMVCSGLLDGYTRLALIVEPGRLWGGSWLIYLDEGSFIPWLVLVTLILLVTPSGSLPGPRWRFLVIVAACAASTLLVTRSLLPGHFEAPYASVAHPWVWHVGAPLRVARDLAGVTLSVAPLAAAASLVLRFRQATGTERQQLRWVGFGAAVAGVALAVTAVGSAVDESSVVLVGSGVALAALPVATGVAVSRYRLFDLDRLVTRTVTWAVVTISLVLLWSSGVLVVSRLASARAGSALPASVATLVTALAAGPILRRVRDTADRHFRRRRYETLRTVAEYVGRPPGTTSTSTIERILATALEDPHLTVSYWLDGHDEYVDAGGHPCTPEADAVIVERDDVRIAAVSASAPRSLLEDACAVALPELAAARLRSALQLRIAEVTASRSRLTTVAAEERRNLERDLHDGAQQRLLAVLCALESTQRAEIGTNSSLSEAIELTRAALGELRDLAHGLRPVNLQDGGLEATLRGVVAGSPLPATIEVRGIPPEPGEEASAVAYYVVAEALTNAAKHAQATRGLVSLVRESGTLRVGVRDDGRGGADPRGSGLRGLSDRAEAIGGHLVVTSPDGDGTEIVVEIPCES
jgi:signal transduction histidine kinase